MAATAPKRHVFASGGQKVYEWEQTLDDVTVVFAPPPGVRAKDLQCKIATKHVTVGLKGNPPFLDLDLPSTIVEEESTWIMDDGSIVLSLQKMRRGEIWKSAFVGHEALTPLDEEEARRQLMLERFQLEHPGFDFSGAEFSGAAPDPRTFMGGVKHA